MKQLIIIFAVLLATTSMMADEFKIGKLTFEIVTPTTVELIDADKDITNVFLIEKIDYKGNSYTLTSIGDLAFMDCTSLTSVTIPNSVTSIGWRAFEGCKSLTSMVFASGNSTYDSRDNCNAIIETATNTLIAGCQNTTIPNSITSIGSLAFRGCSSLTSVRIPNSVTSIGNKAFEECSSLRSVTIPYSVTSIDDAFPEHTQIIRQ